MEPNSQLSYAVVYNAADAESLAFNQNTVSGAHQEKPTFLSLPIKRNSLAMKTATLSKLTTGVKDFIVKSFNRSEKPIEVKPTNGIVDFKATLLPIICHLTPEDLKLSNALAAMELDGSIKRFLNHVELMLPSDSQWSNLNSLRIHAGSPDRSSEGVEKIAEYYAQLLNMEQNFSFQNETVVIEFEWTEAFSPESRFVTRCIHYEKAAVLFNLAAIFSHLGASQRLWAPKGKQNAADYFKRAAGVLLHVRDTLSNQVPSGFNPTNDLHEQSLTAFSSLMLAQAMECYYEKSIEDQASSDLISKIAVQCADFYAVSTRNLKSHLSVIESRCQKQWLYQSKAKWRLYSAIAHFHARTTLPAEKAVAERVCRLTLAKDLVIKAHNHALKVGRELEDLVKVRKVMSDIIIQALIPFL